MSGKCGHTNDTNNTHGLPARFRGARAFSQSTAAAVIRSS